MALAGSIAAEPSRTSSHRIVPAVLAAVPLGLSCAGVARAWAGAGWRPAVAMAVALGVMTATAMLCCLAGIPLGKVQGDGGELEEGGE